MKRALLPASALVLVVTACGAGAKPAPRVTEVGARVASVHAIVALRRRVARREAWRLLREFVPPPEARRDRARRDHGGVLGTSGTGPLGEAVDAHRLWAVRESLAAVMAFVGAHAPHGFGSWGSSFGTRPHSISRTFARPVDGEPSRILNVTAVALPGRTVIRVDAKAVWVYPRSPSEAVPPATREILVHAPRISATVTSPARVARIVRWFDALPISPPGVVVACPMTVGADITLSFRNTDGRQLAQAEVPPRAATVCDTIGFQIGGEAQKPLVDRDPGKSFVRRLQRLLGVRLVRADR